MITKDIVDTARDILFKIFEENIDVFKKSEGYEDLDISYFSAFSYESILGSIKEDLAKINHFISLYKKDKNDKIVSNTAIAMIGTHMHCLDNPIFDLWVCVSMTDYLPFWIEPSNNYKIPKEYFKNLKGKEEVEQIYKEVFNGENMFGYIQSELVKLLKQTRLDVDISQKDLLSCRGDENIDDYIKKSFETLINFSDIFNKASSNNDTLCMCMALEYMRDSLYNLDKILFLFEMDISRIKYFTKRLKYINDFKERKKYGF